MKQLALVSLITLALFGAFALPVGSQSPGTLETKVTPEFLSVTITGGPVLYGSVPLSTADNSRSKEDGGPITVTNSGSVPVDFVINGSDATTNEPENEAWDLSCDPGTVAENQFVHKYLTDLDQPYEFDAFGVALCPVGEANEVLQADVLPTGSTMFVLEIAMPTASTGFAERTSQVIVTAVPD